MKPHKSAAGGLCKATSVTALGKSSAMVEKVVCAARALRGGVVGNGELHQRGESERKEMLFGVTRLVGMNRDVPSGERISIGEDRLRKMIPSPKISASPD